MEVNGKVHRSIAWTYEHPLVDAQRLTGLIAFFDERVDVIIDGNRLERPITPWSTRKAPAEAENRLP